MDEEIEFSDYLFMVRKNIILVLLVFALVFSAVLIYTIRSPHVYEARSQVMVTNQDQSTYLLGTPALRVDMGTQAAIILSTPVLMPVHDALDEQFEIDAVALKDSNVIEITSEAYDPYVAMASANLAAESFVNYTIASRQEEALKVQGFITGQIEQYRHELDALGSEMLEIESKKYPTSEDRLLLSSLKQESAVKEKLLNSLMNRREEVGIMSQERSGNVRIIQPAVYPLSPTRPKLLLNIVLGIMLGGMAGLGIAIAKEYMRNTYRSMAQIEQDFGPVIMGTLPQFSDRSSSPKDYLVQHREPKGRFAESIRMLRTNVSFFMKDKRIKVIAVTSPEKGDGKSTIASNLALALSHSGSKVLLVDSNIRDPILHKVFDKHESPGLADVITGEFSLDQSIRQTTHKGLHVLFAGKRNTSPSELLSSNSMKEICQRLKEMPYDMVIFDSTCLEFSEAAYAASDADAALVVIGHDKTNRDNALKGIKALSKINARIAGVVVNRLR